MAICVKRKSMMHYQPCLEISLSVACDTCLLCNHGSTPKRPTQTPAPPADRGHDLPQPDLTSERCVRIAGRRKWRQRSREALLEGRVCIKTVKLRRFTRSLPNATPFFNYLYSFGVKERFLYPSPLSIQRTQCLLLKPITNK